MAEKVAAKKSKTAGAAKSSKKGALRENSPDKTRGSNTKAKAKKSSAGRLRENSPDKTRAASSKPKKSSR